MFKKANASELKTWMFGDILMFMFLSIVTIVSITNLIDDFTVGKLVLVIILGLLLVFSFVFLMKIIRAYLSVGSRTIEREEREAAEAEQEAKEKEERLAQHMAEMEEIRRREDAERARIKGEMEKKEKEKARIEAARKNAADPNEIN